MRDPGPPGDSLSACFSLALCLGGPCLLLIPFSVFHQLAMKFRTGSPVELVSIPLPGGALSSLMLQLGA